MLAAVPLPAQSIGDFAAWTGIMISPVGSLPGLELPSGGTVDRRTQLAVRLGSWKFDGPNEERNSIFGASIFSPVGTKALFGATLAFFSPGEGGDGTLMAGVDLGTPVWVSASTEPTAVSIDVKGSLGFGHYLGDGGDQGWSLVGQVPFKIRHVFASKSMISGFVSPGFGFAGFKDDIDSESGTRGLIGFGGAWTFASGFGIHLGGQQVLIEGDPPWVWALSGTFPIGQKK